MWKPNLLVKVLQEVDIFSRQKPILLLGGGGKFASSIRDLQEEWRFSDDAAHWMAIAGMEQFSYMLIDKLSDAQVFVKPDIPEVGSPGVFLPYNYLRENNELPHNWAVTSDSIAAHVCKQLPLISFGKITCVEGQSEIDPFFIDILGKYNLICHLISVKNENDLESFQKYLTGDSSGFQVVSH